MNQHQQLVQGCWRDYASLADEVYARYDTMWLVYRWTDCRLATMLIVAVLPLNYRRLLKDRALLWCAVTPKPLVFAPRILQAFIVLPASPPSPCVNSYEGIVLWNCYGTGFLWFPAQRYFPLATLIIGWAFNPTFHKSQNLKSGMLESNQPPLQSK